MQAVSLLHLALADDYIHIYIYLVNIQFTLLLTAGESYHMHGNARDGRAIQGEDQEWVFFFIIRSDGRTCPPAADQPGTVDEEIAAEVLGEEEDEDGRFVALPLYSIIWDWRLQFDVFKMRDGYIIIDDMSNFTNLFLCFNYISVWFFFFLFKRGFGFHSVSIKNK